MDIIGGTEVPDDDALWPFMAGVTAGGGPLGQYCGATVVAPQWVLTAAHCYQPSFGLFASSVVAGGKELSYNDQQEVSVDARFIHPDFDPEIWANDVMLLHLATPFSSPVAPIEIATPAEMPAPGDDIQIAGWGDTAGDGSALSNVLREATVEFGAGSCSPLGSWNFGPTFCAAVLDPEPHTNSRNFCFGDDGGPAVFDNGGGLKLIGVQSWNESCFYSSMYADVSDSSIRNWIEETLESGLAWGVETLDFGNVNVRSGKTETAKLRNFGSQPWAVGTIVPFASNYSISTDECSGTVLAPGGECTVWITITPSANATYEGFIQPAIDSLGYGPKLKVRAKAVGDPRGSANVAIAGKRFASTLRIEKTKPKKRRGSKKKPKPKYFVNVLTQLSPYGFLPPPNSNYCAGELKLSGKITGVRGTVGATASYDRTVSSVCNAPIRIWLPGKPRSAKKRFFTFSATFSGNTFLLPQTFTRKLQVR